MAVYELTRKAENEIERIYDYSIVNFGLIVAHDYLYSSVSIVQLQRVLQQKAPVSLQKLFIAQF
jgi:plasmid stabilization system protein ParE